MKLKNKLTKKQAYSLLHYGVLAFSEIERNGIRIDTDYLDQAIYDCSRRVKELTDELKSDEVYKAWRRRYGQKMNLLSPQQLSKVLVSDFDIHIGKLTEKGNIKADREVLEGIDHPFVRKYLLMKQLQKTGSTFLKGIKAETVNGFLHPFFNLHTTDTFRSSSDSPNFQNFPKHNPVTYKIVRQCFISRKGCQIGELDYGQLEVRVAACYNRDPRLISYIKDPSKDMHRDMAAQIYKVSPNKVSKETRYAAKNCFVFPEFYGSYFKACAENLWSAIDRMNLQVNGVPMQEWLKRKGINRIGPCNPNADYDPDPETFEYHVQQVEKDFWENRFKVYTRWKKAWWYDYLNSGWFDTFTGFRISGVLSRNQVINYPVQGSAFHCLLWSTIQLQRWLKKYKMKTKIIGQIHDSIVFDFYRKEIDDVIAKAVQIMTVDICKVWKWIIVPLEVEAEISPLGGSWYDKEEYKI